MEELKVGSEFWALQINGHYGPSGDPFDFTIVDETKTLWRVRRTCEPDHKPFNIKKDMSEYHQISAEDAAKVKWMRTNSNNVVKRISELAKFGFYQQLENYDMLKAVAEVIGYTE